MKPQAAEREKNQQKQANWLDFLTENPPHLMVDHDFRSYLDGHNWVVIPIFLVTQLFGASTAASHVFPEHFP